MYSASSIYHGLKNPELIGRELNRLVYTQGKRFNCNPSGTSIFQKDWDNLILLDSLRFDVYKDCIANQHSVESIESVGSATYEFLPATFTDQSYYDTVIVTANPQYVKYSQIIDVHDLIYVPKKSNSNSDLTKQGVVDPSVVTDYAKQMTQEYPNKRLVIHYLQPHRPYIGKVGSKLEQQGSLWRKTSLSDIRKAYRENLKLVLDEAQELISYFNGKTVVSSDHGEMLGERYTYVPMKDFGHHSGLYEDILVEVPWHVYDGTSRKRIISEKSDTQEMTQDVKEQLELLGYT